MSKGSSREFLWRKARCAILAVEKEIRQLATGRIVNLPNIKDRGKRLAVSENGGAFKPFLLVFEWTQRETILRNANFDCSDILGGDDGKLGGPCFELGLRLVPDAKDSHPQNAPPWPLSQVIKGLFQAGQGGVRDFDELAECLEELPIS